MKIILVGFMGAGKTTVGRLLARELQCQHHDLDDLIVQTAGKSIPEIFSESGNTGFRALEHETLVQALDMVGILSTGGGTPIQAQNYDLLRTHATPVVLLDADPTTIMSRIGGDANRPLVKQLGETGLIELKAERNPRYYELADLVIQTDELTPEDIVGDIVAWLNDGQKRVAK